MLRILTLIICIGLSIPLMADDTTAYAGGGDSMEQATKILLIPYRPDLYLSDADQQLAERNNISPMEFAATLRASFDRTLMMNVNEYTDHVPVQMMTSSDPDVQNDLLEIYKALNFSYETPLNLPIEEQDLPNTKLAKKAKFVLSKLTRQNASDEYTNMGEPTAGDHQGQYLGVHFDDPKMLDDLAIKYGTDLFLFVNQMEIISHYESCLDRATDDYAREFKVHYSVYNRQGTLLYGNYIAITSSSNATKMSEIISHQFSRICAYLASRIPKDPKLREQKQEETTLPTSANTAAEGQR